MESSLAIVVPPIARSTIHIIKQGTATESSYLLFCALFLLYDLGLTGLRVTGLMTQVPRRFACGMSFAMVKSVLDVLDSQRDEQKDSKTK